MTTARTRYAKHRASVDLRTLVNTAASALRKGAGITHSTPVVVLHGAALSEGRGYQERALACSTVSTMPSKAHKSAEQLAHVGEYDSLSRPDNMP